VGYLCFIHPDLIRYIQPPFAIASLFSVLIFAWFGASIRFTDNKVKTRRHSLLSWWIILWAGLIGFIFIAEVVQIVITNFNPYVAKLYISNESYAEAVRPFTEYHHYAYWGYFAALICYGLGLSYVYYNKQGVPCSHRLAAPLVSQYFTYKKCSIWFKAFGESHVHLVFMTWFGMVMLSLLVLLATAFQTLINVPSFFKIPIISMSFFSLFFLFFVSSYFGKKIQRLNSLKLDLSMVTFIFILIIIAVLLVAGKVIELILAHSLDMIKMVECDCTISPLKLLTEFRMQNLAWAVWILTLPLMATFVARISGGRSVKEVVLGILSLAIFIQVIIYFYPVDVWFKTLDLIHDTAVQFILGTGLAVFMLLMFYKKQNSWIFNNGLMTYLPRKNDQGEDVYKVSELSFYDGTKVRGLAIVSRKWLVMCFGMLLVHTIGGWQVVQLELALFAAILVFLYFFALVGIWIEWKQDGVF
jgi:hypothetical protein